MVNVAIQGGQSERLQVKDDYGRELDGDGMGNIQSQHADKK
jgi:hypothetical protein